MEAALINTNDLTVEAKAAKRENAVIKRALAILESRLRKPNVVMEDSEVAKGYLRLHYRDHEREEFNVLFLTSSMELIANETLAIGTIDMAHVYPREVAKAALRHNAAHAILVHNHPSSKAKPSDADHDMTRTMQKALNIVGVNVLDHFVVGNDRVHSFAENGQLDARRNGLDRFLG